MKPGVKTIELDAIAAVGPIDLARNTGGHASEMYSRNVFELIRHLSAEGDLVIDLDDEITAAVSVTAGGELRSDPVRRALEEAS